MSVTFLRKTYETSSVKSTNDPTFTPKDATFDFPLHLSLAEIMGPVEFIVWDKDKFRKDYIGELSLPIKDWPSHAIAFEDPNNQVRRMSLPSTAFIDHPSVAFLRSSAVNEGWHTNQRIH